jgi:four helix bundle protein
MTRAAVSITSNIADGHERGSGVQYVEYRFYAKGSAGELRSQIVNAHDVGLLDDEAFRWLHDKVEDVSCQLAGYVKHLVETAGTIRGMKHTREADRRHRTWDEIAAGFGLRRLADGGWAI